jgi:hypothetical protein
MREIINSLRRGQKADKDEPAIEEAEERRKQIKY